MYSLDLAKAEEHLKVAWGGQVWEKGFKFTILYNLGSLWRETACKILAENLAKINARFEVSIQPMNWSTGILPGLKSGLVPMFTAAWMGDYPHPNTLVVPFMASYGFWADFQRYGYPELDQLIERAFGELDPAVQKDIYCEVQERYYEDAPGVMLVQLLSRRYFTKYVHGFCFNPMIPGQAGPLYYMSKSSS
jgi:peptide/nickel transport system substrate-binding protein